MKQNSVSASWFFCFASVNELHCIGLLKMATLKSAVCCCSATRMCRQMTICNYSHLFSLVFCMKRNCFCTQWFFNFYSVKALHCICLLKKATLKPAVCCCSAKQICRRRTAGNCTPLIIIIVLYEAKLCSHKLILLLFFRKNTPLHWSAYDGHLETCRLLLQCNADIEANDWL